MNLESITRSIKQWLIQKAIQKMDVATLRSAFTSLLAPLKEKAGQTENVLDDWAVEAFEALIADDAKMALIHTFLLSRLTGNLCESLPQKYGFTEYEALASALVHTPGECESTEMCEGSWGASLAKILEAVIPVILEWFQKMEESR